MNDFMKYGEEGMLTMMVVGEGMLTMMVVLYSWNGKTSTHLGDGEKEQ